MSRRSSRGLEVPTVRRSRAGRVRRTLLSLGSIAGLYPQATIWDGSTLQTPTPGGVCRAPARLSDLSRRAPGLLDSAEVRGMAIASIARGKVVWARGFGARSAVTGAPVNDSTVFEAASLSKPLFAYGVMRLVERGRLRLDEPLANYLANPELESDARYKLITARMVLSHQSGLPNGRPSGILTLGFEPGTRWGYSGEGFLYLQRVIEHLEGQPLHRIMVLEVFEPLGMTRSSYVWEERFGANVAVGERELGVEKTKPQRGSAAGSLHTTARDYARFMAAMLEGRGLSQTSLREMLSEQVGIAPGVSWALGWALEQHGAGRAFWHWGDSRATGYTAFAIGYPELDCGVVVLTNGTRGLSFIGRVLELTIGGAHPLLSWPVLGYEPYDAPRTRVIWALERAFLRNGIQGGLRRYQELRKEYPSDVFSAGLFEELGRRVMLEGNVAALGVFALSAEAGPLTSRAFQGLGDAYRAIGLLGAAIANYQKALDLDPSNESLRITLERMRAEVGTPR